MSGTHLESFTQPLRQTIEKLLEDLERIRTLSAYMRGADETLLAQIESIATKAIEKAKGGAA